jgi:hypothetical protein
MTITAINPFASDINWPRLTLVVIAVAPPRLSRNGKVWTYKTKRKVFSSRNAKSFAPFAFLRVHVSFEISAHKG